MTNAVDGWRTASVSDEAAGSQVWVKSVGGAFAVSDSDEPDGAVLVWSAAAWSAFITGAKRGEFDS